MTNHEKNAQWADHSTEKNAQWEDHSTKDDKNDGVGGGYVRKEVERWESFQQAQWWDVSQAKVGPANLAQGTYVHYAT